MTRFNTKTAKPQVSSPIKTTGKRAATHEGFLGWERDVKSELFLLGVANFWNTNTFYEDAKSRDNRFVQLVRALAISDPQWTAAYLKWLRAEGNMRTVAIVGAAEFVHARLHTGPGVVNGVDAMADGLNRQVVNDVCQRADEPGELLSYWISVYGRKIPKPVKRGLADAARRLYNERNLLKYDTASHAVRFGDVLELTHPAPAAPFQESLFKFAIDRRHDRDELLPGSLVMLKLNADLRSKINTFGDKSALYDPNALRAAGMTWEDALSLAGSQLNKRKLWEAMIPSMGVMALTRNLRNFEQAKISPESVLFVQARLMDPEVIAKSRMFPFRFYAAHKNTGSFTYSGALDVALSLSLANVPALKGNTLILVDQSYSMNDRAAGSLSDINRSEAAQIFGSALALRAEKATLVQYDDYWAEIPFRKGDSVLRTMERFQGPRGGTDTWGTLRAYFSKERYDRVVIITDEQVGAFRHTSKPDLGGVPLYTWNLGGYKVAHSESGKDGWHTFGGLSDASFRAIPLIEAARDAAWPWEDN